MCRFPVIRAACLLALLFTFSSPAAAQNDQGFPNYQSLRDKAAGLWTGKNTAGGAYVVLVPPDSPLMKAAKKLAERRKAEIIAFSPAAPEDCLPELIKRNVRYAAIFVEPKEMDVNLLRRFIVISTLLDSDPFCDFAFGFITASTPQKVEEFVERIIAAERNGLPDYAVQISASNMSIKYETSFLPGMKGETYYINEGDTKFAREAISQFGRAGFIHIGACSDPEGIWLFNDDRNRHAEKHWPFDPKKVGQDPKGEMPRITADYFKGVKLNNAVVWTHACHLGAVGRVFVESDIVSTFGETEKLEEYWIPEGRSMALAIIDAGVSAYVCPIGANFGMQASLERDIAIETGIPLGDVLRRGYHDIVMDTNGHPEKIGIFAAGKPKYWEPDAFNNNNAPQHRCLYGDPLFAPFKDRKAPPSVTVTTEEKDDGIRIAFKLTTSGFDVGRTWYGNRGETCGRGRFYEEIPLRRNIDQASIKEVKTSNADGKPFSLSSQTVLIEKIDGKTVLHVQLVTDDLDKLELGGGEPVDVSVLQKAGASAEVYVTYASLSSAPDVGKKEPGGTGTGPDKLGDGPPVEPPEKKPPQPPQVPKVTAGPNWLPEPVTETPELAAKLRALLAQHGKVKELAEHAQVVSDIGRLRTLSALRALIKLFDEEKEVWVRRLLVSAIADVDGKEAAQALLGFLCAEKEQNSRFNIRNMIIQKLGTKEAAEVLLCQGLQHKDPCVRATAAEALGRTGWPECVQPLIGATKDADPAARVAAIEALKQFPGGSATDCLLALASGNDEEAAFTALWAMDESNADDRRILETARMILERQKPLNMQMQALHLFGTRRDASALKLILKFLGDREWRLRAAAIEALAKIRHKDSIEPLIGRLDAEDGRLASDVAQALADITGISFGCNSKRWRQWWKDNKAGFQPPAQAQEKKPVAPGMTQVLYHDIPVVSKRIIFLLDVSSSMKERMDPKNVPSGPDGRPAGDTRLDFCKWELTRTIRRLPKDIRFNIITFDSLIHPWKSEIVLSAPANRADAEKFIEKQTPTGATNLYEALQCAFQDKDADTFYVLSDGQPTDGAITDTQELLDWVKKMNASRAIVINTISAGELVAVTNNLLKKIADENGGTSVSLK